MRTGNSDFIINMDAIIHMQVNNLPQKPFQAIIENRGVIFADESQWNDFLTQNGIVKDRHVQIATEGVLSGLVAAETMQGINDNTVYSIPYDRLKQVLAKYNRLIG